MRALLTLALMGLTLFLHGCKKLPPENPATQSASRSCGSIENTPPSSQNAPPSEDEVHSALLRSIIILNETAYRDPVPERLQLDTSSPWKSYSDEFVSFTYPNDQRLSLNVLEPGEGFTVQGGVVSSAENSWFRTYELKANDSPYCVIMLERADHFDDGICFCGAVELESYLFHNQAIFRFSLMEGGTMKKVQALSNGLRIVFFEYTHLTIPQDAYKKIAMSVRFKNRACNEKEIRLKLFQKYGFESRIGFLRRGMVRSDLLDLLGPPHHEKGDSLFYVAKEDEGCARFELSLTGGVFRELPEEWREELPPERGSLKWMQSAASSKQLTDEDVKLVFDEFAKRAPEADFDIWCRLCQVAYELTDRGYRDSRVLTIVRNRRPTQMYGLGHYAHLILHKYDPIGSKPLFVKILDLSFDEARLQQEEYPGFDTSNLILFLGTDHPEFRRLVLEAMDHPSKGIRGDGYSRWHDLPPADVLPRVRQGLRDASDTVRENSAEALAELSSDEADMTLLKECLKNEQDDHVWDDIFAAIERFLSRAATRPAP